MYNKEKAKILVVDDDPDILEVLEVSLSIAGYNVFTAEDADTLFSLFQQHAFALIILDLRLGNTDGLELANKIRESSPVPIMMLTGKGTESDKVHGLEMVADDYLLKPFNIKELVARVRALVRRSTELSTTFNKTIVADHKQLRFLDWVLDLTSRELRNPSGNRVEMTAGEFSLLRALTSAPNRPFSREELLKHTRGDGAIKVYDRTIDVLILRLRKKIEINPKNPQIIRTERGFGYVFSTPVEKN